MRLSTRFPRFSSAKSLTSERSGSIGRLLDQVMIMTFAGALCLLQDNILVEQEFLSCGTHEAVLPTLKQVSSKILWNLLANFYVWIAFVVDALH